MARARKSSSSLGMARKPSCASCVARLLLEVVFFAVGEFIVGLQIMWPDINGLRLRIAAEIHRRQRRGRLAAQQEGNRRSARSAAFQRFPYGPSQCCGSILLQQFEQLRGLAAV